MIPDYPAFAELALPQRPLLHPLFQNLPDGISELSFAGIYLFRHVHAYRISRLDEDRYVIRGDDGGPAGAFFLLPFGLPEESVLRDLLREHGFLKAASESQAAFLESAGYRVEEDRDNFDYLYSRQAVSTMAGRAYHKKKNLYNAFIRSNHAEGVPLLDEYMGEALDVLDRWRGAREDDGDYVAAREALELMNPLQLCGGLYRVDGRPVAYTLGEENARGKSFVIHFEKAVAPDAYKGIYQFMAKTFAGILPEKYETINREQDLGDPGLRQAKESLVPVGFVRKFRAWGDSA